jgi:uncharacterized phage protein (TIGR01671 family)
MRTLKYRVYIKHWGNSENDELVYPKEGTLYAYLETFERGGFKEAIFQQFTGLLDNNGKKIYEGDLLEFAYTDNKKFAGKVEYEEKFACFVLVTENAFETFSDLADYTSSFKVIGNIFENETKPNE